MKKLSFLLTLVLIFSSIAVVPVFAVTESKWDGSTNTGATNTFAKYGGVTSGLTSSYNVAGPQKASNDVTYHVYGTSTIDDSKWYSYCFYQNFKDVTDFKDKTSYAFSVDVFFPSSDKDTKKEFFIQTGVSTKALLFTFRTGEYKTGDVGYNKTSGRVFYGLKTDRWHNIAFDISFDDKKQEVFDVYLDGIKFTEHYMGDANNALSKVSSGTVKPSAHTSEQSGYYLIGRPTLNLVIGEKHDFYFDNVIYKADATYTGDTKATIESAVDGVVTVENDVTLDGIKALATGANAVEIYRANAQAETGYDAITENFATGDIVKLVTANGSYSYYTLNVEEDEEPPVVEPDEPENPFVIGDLTSDLDVSDRKVSASVKLTGGKADKDVTLVVCLYKGITLIDMVPDSVATGEDPKTLSASISVPEGENYIAKAFVWDSLEGMNMIK